MYRSSSKKLLLTALVACFVVQTGLVYTDDKDLALSEAAVRGRRIYHDEACQVCHQLWGQGGFLGPDLTNAASRVDETRLASLLTDGSGQMPALGLTPEQVADVGAFLREIDRPDLGRGELRLGDPATRVGPQAAFEAAVLAAAPPAEALRGFEIFSEGVCTTCHVPFQVSAVGAPDVTDVAARLDEAALRTVLVDGRPERGMPPPAPAFDPAELDALLAYFRWTASQRDDLMRDARRRGAAGEVRWSSLPWWEYR